MALFAIGDTHLSLGSDKPMDIFGGWQDYTTRLEKNWRQIVTPDDTVVIPGDISWAMRLEDAKEDLKFLDSLPGRKIIGKGNHDYWWMTMKKLTTFVEENELTTLNFLFNNSYEVSCESGTFAVCGSRGWFFDDDSAEQDLVIKRECGRIRTSIESAKEKGLSPIVFLHYPPISNDRVCDPIVDTLLDCGIDKCYYAHLHGNSINYAFKDTYKGIKFDLVSSDALGFVPKLIAK
ncbi:MAG: metallophosphoesterase [Oscillospiraceae bacterium]|nr:metallophosphoesterase [Candidatus Limimonas coprohippi]